MEVNDPDGDLLNFGDLNEQAAILLLGSNLLCNTFEETYGPNPFNSTPGQQPQAQC